MKPQEVIQMIRKAVSDVRDRNEEVVSVEALLNYLTALDQDVASIDESDGKKLEVDLAMFRAEHERNLAHYDAQQQNSRQMWDSVFTYGQAALKSAILINGGAAAGLLAFIGNIWSKGINPLAVEHLTDAILAFALGVLSAAVGTGTTYVTQYGYCSNWKVVARTFHILTLIVVVASYVLFMVGSHASYIAFFDHLSKEKPVTSVVPSSTMPRR